MSKFILTAFGQEGLLMFKIKKSKQSPDAALLDTKKGLWHNHKYIILSFIIPFAIMSLAFGAEGIAPFGIIKTAIKYIVYGIGQLFPQLGITVDPHSTPLFGDNQVMVIDAWHQYYPFLNDLHEKLQSGGSAFWTWSVGLGANFIALGSYYLFSPLNLLSVLVPDSMLVGYLAFITAVKIACCGMFTAIALRIIFKRNDYSLLLFSVMFSLCSFNLGYYWCVMWLDSVAMLPLVVAGTVCLLRDGKYKLFTLSLALAVIFNYYIGFFICVAVFFTALGYTVINWNGFKPALKGVLKTAACSVTALLITAFVSVPAFLALQNCYASPVGMPTTFSINHGSNNILGLFGATGKVFGNMLSFVSPTYMEGLPNIACGILCIILLGVFLFSKRIKLNEKIFCSATLVFLAASFIFSQLDYVMHAFHFPNMLPHRYSFIFSFILIFMAYRAFSLVDTCRPYRFFVGGLIFAVLAALYIITADKRSLLALLGSAAIAVTFIAIFVLSQRKIISSRIMPILLCTVVIAEMGIASYVGVKAVGSTQIKHYSSDKDDIASVLEYVNKDSENEFFRTEKTYIQTRNDGALYQYNGISTFSSMVNSKTTAYAIFLGTSGTRGNNSFNYYESSPVTNLIFNLKYLFDTDNTIRNADYLTEVARSGDVTLYENTAYVPMGFVTDKGLADFDSGSLTENPGNYGIPFENQINWFRAATGIEDPVYTKVPLENIEYSADSIKVKEGKNDIYSCSVKKADSDAYIQYNYTLEQDGLAYVSMRSSIVFENIYLNLDGKDKIIDSGSIHSAGRLKAGDKISVRVKYNKKNTGKVKAYCYILNEDVFNEGVAILSKNTLKQTKATDTVIAGSITAYKDGLLYTSIPYESGWRVKVDGKDADITLVGNSMCAVELTKGKHSVEFYYIPVNFLIGLAVSLFGLAIFVFICFITSKKISDENRIKQAVEHFLEPNSFDDILS